MLKFENHCYSPEVDKLLSVSQLFVFALMAESEEELKSLLMKVKEESEKLA